MLAFPKNPLRTWRSDASASRAKVNANIEDGTTSTKSSPSVSLHSSLADDVSRNETGTERVHDLTAQRPINPKQCAAAGEEWMRGHRLKQIVVQLWNSQGGGNDGDGGTLRVGRASNPTATASPSAHAKSLRVKLHPLKNASFLCTASARLFGRQQSFKADRKTEFDLATEKVCERRRRRMRYANQANSKNHDDVDRYELNNDDGMGFLDRAFENASSVEVDGDDRSSECRLLGDVSS